MGICIVATTTLLALLYFPEEGGMFCKAGALKYDPQLIKPPEGYRGADSMDYASVVPGTTTKSTEGGAEESRA